jgi:hypothetical protein
MRAGWDILSVGKDNFPAHRESRAECEFAHIHDLSVGDRLAQKPAFYAGLVEVLGSLRIFSDSLKWWSRGESNPRPQVLRYKIYVRSRVY